jgi:hypothetical protein
MKTEALRHIQRIAKPRDRFQVRTFFQEWRAQTQPHLFIRATEKMSSLWQPGSVAQAVRLALSRKKRPACSYYKKWRSKVDLPRTTRWVTATLASQLPATWEYLAAFNSSLIKRALRGFAEREGCSALSSTRFPLADNRLTDCQIYRNGVKNSM